MRKFLFQNKKGILKFAITCAMVVSSVAFASNSTLAEEITINNGDETPAANSIRNTTYYATGNILNVQPQSTITVYGNLYEGTISGITDLIINGNGSLIDSQSTNNNFNYGYQLSNGSSITINDLSLTNFGKDNNSSFSSENLYGAAIYVMDENSSAQLNNVSITGSSLSGNATVAVTKNLYGGAIANNGRVEMTGGSISDNIITATSGILAASGVAHGGAIYNTGDMYISGTTVSNNSATAQTTWASKNTSALGGGIFNNGNLTLTDTTFSNNSVGITGSGGGTALGGGIYTTKDITLAGGNSFKNNTDGSGANDIYFESGNLLVNGSGSDKVNTISSGLASSGNSHIILTDGGKLVLEGNNTRFTNGSATVGTDSILTYSGSLSESILAGTTTVNGDNGAVELVVADGNFYNLDSGKVLTSDGVSGQFIKSGKGQLNLINGDYSSFSGDVVVNGGVLYFEDAKSSYINAKSNYISQGSKLIYSSANNAILSTLIGAGTLDKNGEGDLTVTGDNSGFSGVVNMAINGGDLIFDNTNGDIFFAHNATVNLNNNKLIYNSVSSENLTDANFANISLLNNAIFEYTANSGITSVDNSFYTSDGSGSLVFNGKSNSDFILNNNLDKLKQVSFNDARIYFADGLYNLTNNLNLNNSIIDVMNQSIQEYTFSNLTAENSSINIDVNLGSNLGSDLLSFTGGSGVLNITSLGIIDDDGSSSEKTVQVIQNNGSSNISILQEGLDPTIAGWSTNVYEYIINATKSDFAKPFYDSLVFKPNQAASPDSLKSMNNYKVVPTRGFSLVEDSVAYHIARDLGQTEYGIFNVNGVGKEESIISGYRVSYTDNGDGTFTYYPETITQDRGSFFELTDTKGAIELNISDITIQDADRTNQSIKGGSIIYSNIANAVVNVDNAAFNNSHSVGNGGAFDIENAQSIEIKNSDFSGNTSDSLGGAIYSAIDLNITNANFSNNTDKDGKNDITLANGANVLYTVEEGKTSGILSGIKTTAGNNTSSFTKSGAGVLNISGQNALFKGNVNLIEGNIIFNTVGRNDSFFGYSDGSKITIADGTSLTINNGSGAVLSGGHFAGSGDLNINTSFSLHGNNADYTGVAVIDGHSVEYIPENSGDTIFGGEVQFLNGAQIWTPNNSSKDYVGGNFVSNDTESLFHKSDNGNFKVIGDNSGFKGEVWLNGGTTTFEKNANSAFFGGEVSINSTLNYKTTLSETLNNVITGSGTLNKTGSESLTLNNSNFWGSANIEEGILNVTSQNAKASNLDFVANISSGATLNYIAGANSSITLGGADNKLNFLNGAQNATASITASNIVLDTILNASGNNIVVNDANVVFNQQNYAGNYTFNNSVIDLIVDREIKEYNFDNLVSSGSELKLDVSLGDPTASDKLIVNGGSGVLKITELAILDDDGMGGDKFVQVIQNNNGSTLSLVDESAGSAISPSLAAWSTNVYEYEINAAKSNEQNNYYDGLIFEALAAATPNSLRIMNHEREGLRGFSVVTDDVYNIGQDLDETLAGNFSVNGKDKNTSIISGVRASGYNSSSKRGSFFEVINDTDLTIRNLTIQDALRQTQTIEDGSVVYLNNNFAGVEIVNSVLKNNEAVGKGGVISAITGELLIQDSEFTGNKAGSLGGAIYTETEISIENSNFHDNADSTGANDIYVANAGTVNFDGEGTTTISSGIAGSGVVNKNDDGKLILSGNNSDYTGRFNVNDGEFDFNADSADDSYISGVTNIESGASVNINSSNGTDLNIENGTFIGSGALNVSTTEDSSVILNGDNSGFTGNVNIDNGNLVVNFDSSDDKYFSSNTNIGFGSNLIFDVADGIISEYISSEYTTIMGDGQFVKDGNGTLQISGEWNYFDGDIAVEDGVLELVKGNDGLFAFGSSVIISDDAIFRVNNQSDTPLKLYSSLEGGEDSIFEIAGNKDSVVDISNIINSQFKGETLISNGILAFTKGDYNSFVGGDVNIKGSNSKLVYTTDYVNGEIIYKLNGDGTLDKQGTGELSANMGDFSGLVNVKSGTFVANASEQLEDADGSFGFSANVYQDAVLEFNANSVDDVYNIDSNSGLKFNSENSNATINFVTGNYNISSDLANAIGNNTGFQNAVVNVIGDSDVNLAGSYVLNGDSTLNLANGSITTTTISSLTSNGTNYINLDFDFGNGSSNLGSFDILNVNGGNAQLTLTDDSINVLNMDTDRGFLVSNDYKVLNGATFANGYTNELTSNLYVYTVSANAGSDIISVVATGYVGNTLYTLNHQTDGNRTFHLAGASTDYYIGRALEQTLSGTLNIAGRTPDKDDTIIGQVDASTTDGLSMFEVVNDDTELNIQDVTIKNAQSEKGGSVVYQNNATSSVNIINSTIQNNSTTTYGGALSILDGNLTLEDVLLSSNSAENGGALYANGGTVELSDVVFAYNNATNNGGALYNASGSENLVLSNVAFNNNTAQEGSAIYNLGTAKLTDVTFSGNSDEYIYNGTQGNLTITSAIGDYVLTNGSSTSKITNKGVLNLTAFENNQFTVADKISGGTINTSGNVILNNLISSSIINVVKGDLALNGGTEDYALNAVTLNILEGNSATLGDKNIEEGKINVEGNFNIANTSDISITSDLAGSGVINKTGSGMTSLQGHINDTFEGAINITDGMLTFEKTTTNTFFSQDSSINVKGSNSTFNYLSSDVVSDFNSSFANITLTDGGKVLITGAGRDYSSYTINNGWLNSTGAVSNSLIFNDASYVLNTLFTRGDGIKDNVSFNSSYVELGTGIIGKEITDGHAHDAGALEYNLNGSNYIFTDSILDLSNQTAGDNYNFDSLNFIGQSNGLALDVNLDLETGSGILPYADTITANSGSGIVEITKLFVTDDNGKFITDGDGNQSKGVIRVFKGNNNLQVADSDGVQILSWATNVYKYGVKSASSGEADGHAQDSIEIVPNGASSTDTLRDMNIYDPNKDNTGGNRGFSFIAKDGLQENNNYNIYRDLDTTSAGTFTVQGTLVGEEKSLLSGILEDFELLESENSGNLVKIDDNTWSYNGDEFDAQWITIESMPDGDTKYTIDVRAFTPEKQTNGSMFEVENATDFEMFNVSVQDAIRYEGDSITDGSVFYANNSEANISLNNVDFINNEVQAGNGGAIANYGSKKFAINQSQMQNNKATGNGGVIYNTAVGMSITNAVVDGNSAGKLGGSIYTSADMIIADSNFGVNTLNTHNNGEQNDIYIANNANVEFVTSEGKTSSINSGLAGETGTVFNKTGSGTLNLSGSNEDFAGNFVISSGNVIYNAVDVNDTFVKGAVKVNSNSILTMNISDTADMKDQIIQNLSSSEDGNGSLIKNGAGILYLKGSNSKFAGSTTINQGSIIYNAINDSDRYLGGSTNLAGENTQLVFIIDENIENQIVSRVIGVESSTIYKQGLGDLTISSDNSKFEGTVELEEGKLTYLADNVSDKYVKGNTSISDGATIEAKVLLQDNEGNEIIGQTIGNLIGGQDTNFVKTGEGVIQLVGNNNFAGTTTIEQGILAYTAGEGNFVSGNTDIKENGTLEYTVLTGNDNLKSISGSGILSKLGSGNLNLAGNNSLFKGSVQIGEGRLSYETSSGNKFINANSYEIAENAELYINNTSSENVEVSNLAGYVDKNNQPKGSGKVIKEGNGTVLLAGDNSNFEGTLDINSGSVNFTKDNSTSYIAGNTEIAQNAILNYNTNIADEIINVSGSGILNKGGEALLVFDTGNNSVEKSFVANANEGTLNVIGSSTTDFELNLVANNSATINYEAAVGSTHTIGSTSSVKFGESASDAKINFNGENYVLASDITNYSGNKISFADANIKLTNSNYNGSYIITDSVIDLINDKSETNTFANLVTTGSKIKIDADLTLPNPMADRLVSNGGVGGALELALNEINLNDKKTDNGLGEQYKLNILGGNLTLDNDDTLEYWATSAYQYKVDIAKGGQDIILTAIKASNENSLKAMNNLSGNRGFQFHTDDDNPYIIGSNLGVTEAGSFVVTGTGSTVISGEDSKSFFEVVKDTDITVKDVTIKDAHSNNGGSVVVANNGSANVILNNTNITSSSSNGNGGVINNVNSESFTINNSKITNNVSNSLGGAIYTATNMTIIDTDFSGNSDKNGKNDIYVAGANTQVNIYSSNKDVTLASGLAGDGNINKLGNNALNLSGKNDNFGGNLNVLEGNMNYNQSSITDTYISGNTNIGSKNVVTITNNYSDINVGTFSGDGTLNKDGSSGIKLTGDNSKFNGTVNINNGSVIFNADNTKYFAGTTNINQSGTLAVGGNSNAIVSNINGNGILNKTGAGAIIFQGANGFNGNMNIEEGVFAMASGSSIGNIANAQFAAGTGINLQNTSVVDLGNNQFTTNPSPASLENIYFDKLTLLGDVNLDIDIDLKNELADKIGAGTVYGNGSLILDKDSLNVVSDSILNNTSVQVAYGDLANYVALDQGVTTVMGPIQKYNVSYDSGSLFFTRSGGSTPDIGSVNPAVMASPVATQLGGYLTQLQTLNAGFYHMDRYTKYPYMLRLSAENTNRNAINEIPSYRRSNLPETSNAMWVQPYTTFEQVNLRGGIGVSNVAYGAMYGGDSDLVDLGHGFKGVISTFVGYNGSHMSFNGVSMNQQGGALGLTGTLYKGNFFTGLTLSAGASAGDAYTQYGTDHFAMLNAGVASKTGYNLELKDGKLIIQPSLFLGYTFTNTFDYTNAAGVRIDSDPLHAITISPGVKVIANLKNGWQPYAGVNMVWSIMDKTNVMAQDVRLPQLSVKPYVEYGVGVQKSWGQRFTAFFQTMIRNVGRTGIVLTAGFRWTLGKEPKHNDKSVNNQTQKKVIKSL